MSRFTNLFTLFVVTMMLMACDALPSDYFLSEPDKKNKEWCLAFAQAADGKWRHEPLEQMYAEEPDKMGDQKSYLARVYKAANICVAALSPKPPIVHDEPTLKLSDLLAKSPPTGEYKTSIAAVRNLSGRIEAAYLEPEKKQFLQRTHGAVFCNKDSSETDSLAMNLGPNTQPDTHCLYVIPQDNAIPLTVMQATREGILATVRFSWVNGVIYLANDNKTENGLVDGARVPPGYFVYTGVQRYQSLTGERSVYGFRRIPNPFEGLFFFDGHLIPRSSSKAPQNPAKTGWLLAETPEAA